MRWLWSLKVIGHVISAMSPLDRSHTTSYSSFVETMCPFCTVIDTDDVGVRSWGNRAVRAVDDVVVGQNNISR